MTRGTPNTIRNVVLASYPGAGKTALAEALVFSAGSIPAMGSCSAGTTISDFEPEEIQHHHSMSSALLHYVWKDTAFHVIDAPGSLDFEADIRTALYAGDGVVLVIDATSVRAELERVWSFIQDRELPCVVFINFMDKDQANFEATLEELEKLLEVKCLPVSYPLKEHGTLTGVLDLLDRQAILSDPTNSKVRKEAIPEALVGKADELRKQLTEGVAEVNDQLLEKYLAEGELTLEEIQDGLAIGTSRQSFLPVVCGSATQFVGISLLQDLMTRCLPSPTQRAAAHPLTGRDPVTDEPIARSLTAEEPLSAFVFKTTIDPFMGRLSYVRVHSGTLEADSALFNASRNSKEKGGHVYQVLGKKYSQLDKALPGEIVAIGKLKDTQTGDTLCTDKHPIEYPGIELPRPVMSFALEPKSKNDIDKVSLGLHKLVEEDPSLEFIRNDETKEMLISGVGQTHIEITLEKLKRKYGVEVKLNTPKVAYRETIQKSAQAQGKYKKQTGGHGQYGDCWLQLDPLPRGEGFKFCNKIVGGVIPRNFIPAVEKGVVDAMQSGILGGFPVVDLSVSVYDGSHHPVDSSELAFKVAASMGFKKAMEAAHPILLEPIMKVEVTAPDEMIGSVIGDLNSRRGRILGMDTKGHNQIVKATAPLAELLKYAPALTSLTGGKGSYVMEFHGYEPVPKELTARIIEEHKTLKEAVPSP